jgi:hypothetical protein
MPRARKEIELAIRLGAEPGALGRVLSTVANQNVNVLAYCCYYDRDEAVVLLVTEDAWRAKAALEAAGFSCRANSVVVAGATDQVGGAASLGTKLGHAGIDILYSYASSSGSAQFYAVFKTSDDQRALSVLDSAVAARAA